ncbi:MAG: T9SS type A sorting domain-containing protein, partial [Candidatus Delongbacteria bacterium]
NNIIWNNSAAEGNQIALGGDGSYPIFNNSDILGGKQNVHYFLSAVAIPDSNYVNNIDSDPLFLDEWNGDYFLTENSPCIDLGTESIPDSLIFPVYDLAGNQRIYGSTIDIGAYEWNGVGIEDSSVPQTTELFQNYPNPFNPITSISYALSKAGQAELSVFNLNGQLVRSLVNGKQEKGSHKVEFYACDLTSGLYIYTLKVDGRTVQSRKMMLLK